ncbi:class I SAM-dependent methyltransferase [Pedobacter rhizosphaerae]|uniref:Methyltransferase domain-containing protein n=1 Tax=Pedobacter rhizosphaerae TaxID=390241 RepID=A0A1H9L6M2_9SPHI|nr:class I SAM-dependent methyltransferase [Pedobacter rhizosphaerae]SER07084.1 Methyltransferase domain-containing protein [Pedobacter rhizosphaerae]
MLNNYDRIAPHYDKLSRLVFFKSQVNAQIDQLKYLPGHADLLIVGGGTGWILEEIARVCPAGIRITYVEISDKMINLAKNRYWGRNEVLFYHSGIEDFKINQSFDVILTPFLFDNFVEERAAFVFDKLDRSLAEKGLWFMVDFNVSGKRGLWWKHLLLKTMYAFFQLIRMVEAKVLVDMSPFFTRKSYRIQEEKYYYGGFIKAVVYQK